MQHAKIHGCATNSTCVRFRLGSVNNFQFPDKLLAPVGRMSITNERDIFRAMLNFLSSVIRSPSPPRDCGKTMEVSEFYEDT